MSEDQVFPVPEAWAARAHMDAAAYEAAVRRVDEDPQGFWSHVAKRLDWIKPFSTAKDVSYHRDDFHIRWYADGVLNVSANCLDRHLPARADDVAIIWEGDDPADSRRITYGEAHAEVCRMANVLKAHGVARGDRVTIYLPMIPEAAFAMLACARIGAVHSVIFGGFSAEFDRRPHPGLRLDLRHHRRRGPARRPDRAAEAERRPGPAAMPGRPPGAGGQAHRRRRPDAGGTRLRLCR